MSAYYRVGQYCVDTSTPTAPVLWRCTTAGDKTSSVWAKVSGGGGSGGAGIIQYKLVSDGGDFWICKTWDGTTLGSTLVNITKPFKLRAGAGAIQSEIIGGITFTYTYTAVPVGSVTGYYSRAVSGSDGTAETNIPIPMPLANDIIYAAPCTLGAPFSIAAVALVNSGTGGTYAVNDVLTLVGGTGTKATIQVNTVSAGHIVTYTLLTPGDYTAAPGLSGTGVTGGGGTGATFNLTLATPMIDINADGRAWAEI